MARLLLVEDHADTRQITALMLELCGHEVIAVSDAEQALSAAPESFDVILTDLDLPGVSGAELKRLLDARHSQVPVIIVSGNAEAARIGVALGAVMTLAKPVELATLEVALALVGFPNAKTSA